MFPLTVEYDFSNSTNDVTDFEQWAFVLKRFSTAFSLPPPSSYLPSSKQIFIRDSLPKRVDTLTRFDDYLNGPPSFSSSFTSYLPSFFSIYRVFYTTRIAISIFVSLFFSPRREESERKRERARHRESLPVDIDCDGRGWFSLISNRPLLAREKVQV